MTPQAGSGSRARAATRAVVVTLLGFLGFTEGGVAQDDPPDAAQGRDSVYFIGVDHQNGLNVPSHRTDYSFVLRLRSSFDDPLQVTLTAPLFVDPIGMQVQPRLGFDGAVTTDPITLDISPGPAEVPITLLLSTPLAGEYAGSLELAFDGGPRNVPVKITRSRVASVVVLDTVAPARRTVSDFPGLARVDVSLRDTAAHPSNVLGLEVVRVWERDGDVGYLVDVDTSFFQTGGESVSWPLEMAPGQTRVLSLQIAGLPNPGRFEALLRLQASDATPVQTTATFLLRRPWWQFAAVAALAVLLSAALRFLLQDYRPRLLDHLRIAQAASTLKRLRIAYPNAPPDEVKVCDSIENHLKDLYQKSNGRWPFFGNADVAKGLEFAELKLNEVLGRWLFLRGRARSVGGKPEKEALKLLDQVTGYLLRARPLENGDARAETNEQLELLKQAERKLRKQQGFSVEEVLQQRLHDLTVELPSYEGVRTRLFALEVGVFVLSLSLAVFLGTYLLWVGKYTWGDWNDILITLLWGFGLHQVGGSSFGGIGWIRDQFTGTS